MESMLQRVAVAARRPGYSYRKIVRSSSTSATSIRPIQARYQSSIAPQLSRTCLRRPSRQPILPYTRFSAFHTSRPSRSIPKFSYGISASFTAKDRRYNPNVNVFSFNPYDTIHARRKDKRTRPDSGQDAFFVSRIGESSDIALGVADGVGGWVDSGVDPADFAHGFCDYMAYEANSYVPDTKKPALSARGLMLKGYQDICADDTVAAGGSTACVALARGDGTLEVANLGDSGFIQLRLNAIHNLSDPQTHAFNTPYQLSKMEKQERDHAALFGATQLCDLPRDANVSKHDLRHGDVLVFASDGVWDNLSAQDILRVVSRLMISAKAWEHTEDGIRVGDRLHEYTMDAPEKGELPPSLQSFLAIGITGEAKAASVNTKKDGPFAREVQRYYPNEHWRGGKVDDICVVVAIVVEEGK